MKPAFIVVAASAAAAAACSTTPKRQASPPIVMAVTQAPASPASAPAATYGSAAVSDFAAEPIRTRGHVEREMLNGYEDENGVVYGPQVRWKWVDGRWNMDAINHPGKAYTPPDMAGETPAPGAINVPSAGDAAPPVRTKSVVDLYKIDGGVDVTGFFEESQEPIVREMATKAGKVPYRDEKLGWVLLPKAALQPGPAAP